MVVREHHTWNGMGPGRQAGKLVSDHSSIGGSDSQHFLNNGSRERNEISSFFSITVAFRLCFCKFKMQTQFKVFSVCNEDCCSIREMCS